jgi:membrane fusion protein, heavy metal efflux system
MRWRSVLRTVAVLLLLAGVGFGAWTQRHRFQKADPPANAGSSGSGPVDIQSVKLSEEAVLGLALRSEEARLEDYPKVIEVPGVLTDAPGRTRAVSVPVAGIVAKVHVAPGEAVRPGDPLFTVQLASEFVQTTLTDLARSVKDLVAATAKRDQTKKLVDAGTKPGFELVEDENQVRRLTGQVEGHRRQLLLFGLNADQVKRAESGEAVTEIVIAVPPANPPPQAVLVSTRTGPAPDEPLPFAFEVESLAVAPGQGVTAGQHLARLADYRELFVEGQAFESEAGLVADATSVGRPVGVDFLEPPAKGRSATETKLVIRSVGKADPTTRTFFFYAALANEVKPYERDAKTFLAWRYRPGRPVRLRIPTGTIPNVIVLPTDAIVREGPDAFVFRQNGEVYDRKPVVIVAEDRLNVAIAPGNGIESGVAVLRNNAAAVNRALKALQARGFGGTGGKKGHWHADGSFHEDKD